MYFETYKSDDDEHVIIKRSKASHPTDDIRRKNYMLIDDDTTDESDANKSSSEDGVWVNINDLDEPFYPLKEYKPRYTIPDELIIEASSTGCLLKTTMYLFVFVNS